MIYPIVGTILSTEYSPNSEVIAAKKYSLESDEKAYILLCHLRDNNVTPYVTWIYDAERVACFHGNYCYDFDQAIKDFNERGTI